MIVTAAVASWNERPEDLERCVEALSVVADRAVILGGAYRRYPGATVAFRPDEIDAIQRAASRAGIEVRIVEATELWAGQVAKRTALMRLAAEGLDPDRDWIAVLDVDHVLNGNRESVRRQLEGFGPEVIQVQARMTTPGNRARPMRESAASHWHADIADQTITIGQLFRPWPDITVHEKHFHYRMRRGGRQVELRYATKQPGPVLTDYLIEHLTLFRTPEQVRDSRAFLNDRARLVALSGQEDDYQGAPAFIYDDRSYAFRTKRSRQIA